MFVTKTDSSNHVYFFLIILLGLPFTPLIWDVPFTFIMVLIAVINLILLIFVWHYSSSKTVSFFTGLEIISSRLVSGCANITLLYLIPFLFYVYLLFIIHTLIGIFKGRSYTQSQWVKFLTAFINKMDSRGQQAPPLDRL